MRPHAWLTATRHRNLTVAADPEQLQHVYRLVMVDKVQDLGTKKQACRRRSGGGAFGVGGDLAIAVALTKGALEGTIATAVRAVAPGRRR